MLFRSAKEEGVDSTAASKMVETARSFYKDYYQPIDREIFAAMMQVYTQKLSATLHSVILKELYTTNNSSWTIAANKLFDQTIFADSTQLIALLSNFDAKGARMLMNDPIYQLYAQHDSIFDAQIKIRSNTINQQLEVLYRTYVKGLMEMQPKIGRAHV